VNGVEAFKSNAKQNWKTKYFFPLPWALASKSRDLLCAVPLMYCIVSKQQLSSPLLSISAASNLPGRQRVQIQPSPPQVPSLIRYYSSKVKTTLVS
jgi:hypothetical protein